MLKEKSTQWARLKLLLFVPLAVVLLQAFARPETVRIQESLIDSEVTTISQQSQKWTKDYFDEKIDAYEKKVNGNTKECEKWEHLNVIVSDSTWFEFSLVSIKSDGTPLYMGEDLPRNRPGFE